MKKVWSSAASASEFSTDELVYDFAIDGLAGKPVHHALHHPSKILGPGRPRLGHNCIDHGFEGRRIERRREVALENRDLGGFARREILASSLRELLDRIAALLDQRGNHLLGLSLLKRPAFLHLAVHQGGLR